MSWPGWDLQPCSWHELRGLGEPVTWAGMGWGISVLLCLLTMAACHRARLLLLVQQ